MQLFALGKFSTTQKSRKNNALTPIEFQSKFNSYQYVALFTPLFSSIHPFLFFFIFVYLFILSVIYFEMVQ